MLIESFIAKNIKFSIIKGAQGAAQRIAEAK